MADSSYQPNAAVLSALLLIGLALGGSMFYVLVFPAKPKPISCGSPNVTCIAIPSGVSADSTLNFLPSNITVPLGNFVQWTNKDDSPHTVTSCTLATAVKCNFVSTPSGATAFDSSELDNGGAFNVQLTATGSYSYHCIFHPHWMMGVICVGHC